MVRFFIDRPIFAWVVATVIMLAGMVAINRLPVAQYPTVAPPSIKTTQIYWGAVPFVIIQIIMVALIIIFPNIVSYGDPAEKARLEQQGDVDLSTMMQDGDATQAPTEDSAADLLKNLQSENK